jgi:hypothetical protein
MRNNMITKNFEPITKLGYVIKPGDKCVVHTTTSGRSRLDIAEYVCEIYNSESDIARLQIKRQVNKTVVDIKDGKRIYSQKTIDVISQLWYNIIYHVDTPIGLIAESCKM